ncbi:hypothetical protein FHG87_021131 [Trinorchestia longiramus]|nr:hypothetical protein FHG87_021131 [Trinorchestia longiramus]
MRLPFEATPLYLKLLAVSLATAFHHDWTITEVSETWINSSSVQQEQMQIYLHDDRFRRLYMAAACGAREWCKTVCHQGGGGLLLLNLISAARNKDPSGPPLMKCLTNGRRNNIITAQSGIIFHDSTPVYLHGYADANVVGNNRNNYHANMGAGVGTVAWRSRNGRHSVGVGATVDQYRGRYNGHRYRSRPSYGVGVGYRLRF